MFASTLLCSNIAIFGNVNLSNSRFYIFLPLYELSSDIGLGKEKRCHGIPECANYKQVWLDTVVKHDTIVKLRQLSPL